MLRKLGEERDQTKRVIQVVQSINKGGVPVFDDWSEGVFRHLTHMLFSSLYLTSSQIPLVSFQMSLDLAEFVQQLVVFQNFEVLHMEISLGGTLELLSWLSWVNAFKDTQSAEVLQGYLHLPDGTTTGEVLCSLSLGALLYLSSHL